MPLLRAMAALQHRSFRDHAIYSLFLALLRSRNRKYILKSAGSDKSNSTGNSMPQYQSVDELRQAIIEKHETLSKRLQQVAKYILDNPNDIALETLAVIAERCGGQASTIVRFAKSFGFDGASQMQRLFRDELLCKSHNLGYNERIRRFNIRDTKTDVNDPLHLLEEFAHGSVLALDNMTANINQGLLVEAVEMISEAETIYTIGFRRAFPVVVYLAYALRRVGKRCVLMDGTGGMFRDQVAGITSRDLLIATSYHPYSMETLDVVAKASEQTNKIIAITDSQLSPIATRAKVSFEIREAEVRQFRSLSASLCLAQALVISYAFQKTEPDQQ